MARWNSPVASERRSVIPAIAPADWPSYGDGVRIASEGSNVAMYPLQARDHVLQAVVARRLVLSGGLRASSGVTRNPKRPAVADRDHHDPLGCEAARRR